MLLKFAVTNFKSFKHQQVLDLTAGTGNEFASSLYDVDDNLKVNSTACVIGANGSGKTHLLQAIKYFAKAIESVERVKDAYQPYRLDSESLAEPTAYEILLFDRENERYINYSAAVLNGAVVSESLLVKATGKNAKTVSVFERDINGSKFGKNYNKQGQLLKDTVSDGGLIANYASGINLAPLSCVYLWAQQVMLFDPSNFHHSARFTVSNIYKLIDKWEWTDEEKNTFKQQIFTQITEMAKTLGLAIGAIRAVISENSEVSLVFDIDTLDGKRFTLSYVEAQAYFSEGTFNTINLLVIFFFIANAEPCTVLIDEFDGSLHHKLSEALLTFIRQIKKDSLGSQVLITTHDILLLDKGFRRDSIFVLEKDDKHSSVITRADAFSIRKDAKLSLKYLNNEFGALPKILSEPNNG